MDQTHLSVPICQLCLYEYYFSIFILIGAFLKINTFCRLYTKILSSFTHQYVVSRQKNICRKIFIQPVRFNVVLLTTFQSMDENNTNQNIVFRGLQTIFFFVDNAFKMAVYPLMSTLGIGQYEILTV